MMGMLAMGFAWRRLQPNDRAVLIRRRISLCCANVVSYEEHVAAFIAVRRFVLAGCGPTLGSQPILSHATDADVAVPMKHVP
eukprot:7226505-Alexandrium_andersonii.AAC.1